MFLKHELESFVPHEVLAIAQGDAQKGIPALAKDGNMAKLIEQTVKRIPTHHRLINGDSRHLSRLGDESVHLVVTSPPYWTLKEYPEGEGQLGWVSDYESFLDELDKVWAHCLRVLVPGGRLVVVVGDVCVPRRRFGRHLVYPLHASIQERCRKLGFDNLAPIIWYKIANAKYEAENGSGGFLGKPYEPNGVIKNDVEYILFQRKPGGYRKPSLAERVLSIIPASIHQEWYRQVWTLTGASTRHHPAPYPAALAERLIKMFSFVGDTVLDPFMGTATTNFAASQWGRNSIGMDIEPTYCEMAYQRMLRAQGPLCPVFHVTFESWNKTE